MEESLVQRVVRSVALAVVGVVASFEPSVMAQAVANPKLQHPPVKQVRPQPQAAEVEAPPPIGEPLRPDLEELPTAYAADSIAVVADGLKPAAKGEFETTAQYNARVEALRPVRTYSFWINGHVDRQYDADRQSAQDSRACVLMHLF